MKPWIILPAAGVGSRMKADKPKQYLKVLDKPLLAWTLQRLQRAFPDSVCVIALSEGDPWWPEVAAMFAKEISSSTLITCVGGTQRAASVLRGLLSAQQAGAQITDWVLVHDAVRPCVPLEDLQAVWQHVESHGTSALLGKPVVDSLRRVNQRGEIQESVPRDDLWRVFTPQVFPLGPLQQALRHAEQSGLAVTDESEAFLRAGEEVVCVPGSEQNIKITYPEDIVRAERILASQVG